MPEPVNVSPVRGMRDLSPAECELRDWAVARILEAYRRFGFARIETPALEHLSLLTGGQGGENEKLIYKVLKRGEKLEQSLAAGSASMSGDGTIVSSAGGERVEGLSEEGLRFDLTVPLARYYAANHGTLPQPFKAIQIGPVWRAERPQKGRFRQFTQCDIDVVGEAGEIAEVELILATTEALAALGLNGFTVRVNDRRLLRAIAEGFDVRDEAQQDRLFIALDKLDKVGVEGVLKEVASLELGAAAQGRLTELLRIGSGAETALPFLEREEPLREHTARMRSLLGALEPLLAATARVEFDPLLVRGMGYYTGPIFEISMEGASGSIAGGGRYDRMIGRMLGRDVPACGFSIGFERVIGLLVERGSQPPKAGTRFALLYEPGVDALARVMAEAAVRRGAVDGNSVAVFARRKKLGKQLGDLEKAGFDCVLTLPEGNGPPEEKWFVSGGRPAP